jgi:hypothetical protein
MQGCPEVRPRWGRRASRRPGVEGEWHSVLLTLKRQEHGGAGSPRAECLSDQLSDNRREPWRTSANQLVQVNGLNSHLCSYARTALQTRGHWFDPSCAHAEVFRFHLGMFTF